jgi:hypothetical protein
VLLIGLSFIRGDHTLEIEGKAETISN